MKDKISSREAVLDCIVQYQTEHGIAPTFREIANMVGLKSVETVQFHLKNLKKAGRIEFEPGKARTIRVLRPKEPRTNLDALLAQLTSAQVQKEPADVMQVAETLAGIQCGEVWSVSQWFAYLQANCQ